MELIQKQIENINCLSLTGRLDAVSAPELEKSVQEILTAKEEKLIIDLTGIDYISSAGLRILLVTVKGMKQNSGKLVLCGLTENVKEVFDISGFTSIFNIVISESDAIAEF